MEKLNSSPRLLVAGDPERWQMGAVPGFLPALQPVVHALLQMQDEVFTLLQDFPATLLWERPAGLASPAFHVQHIAGVLDRLFTYARGSSLSATQMEQLRAEGKPFDTTASALLEALRLMIEARLQELQEVSAESVFETRLVGRKEIPSTRFGLYVHAAEHSMRHLGQLLVTVRVLQQNTSS